MDSNLRDILNTFREHWKHTAETGTRDGFRTKRKLIDQRKKFYLPQNSSEWKYLSILCSYIQVDLGHSELHPFIDCDLCPIQWNSLDGKCFNDSDYHEWNYNRRSDAALRVAAKPVKKEYLK